MAAYRTGFGKGKYGVRVYGLDGEITDAIGSVTTAATTVTSAELIQQASASVSVQSSTSAESEKIFQGSATASATTSLTSAGEKIFQGEGSTSASASLSATLQFITNAEAEDIEGSASLTAAGVAVIVSGSIEVTALSGFDASANITAVGETTIEGSTDISINYIRERSVAANTIQGTSGIASVDGREKWETIPTGAQTWQIASDDSQSWSTIPETSITWSNIAA